MSFDPATMQGALNRTFSRSHKRKALLYGSVFLAAVGVCAVGFREYSCRPIDLYSFKKIAALARLVDQSSQGNSIWIHVLSHLGTRRTVDMTTCDVEPAERFLMQQLDGMAPTKPLHEFPAMATHGE